MVVKRFKKKYMPNDEYRAHTTCNSHKLDNISTALYPIQLDKPTDHSLVCHSNVNLLQFKCLLSFSVLILQLTGAMV